MTPKDLKEIMTYLKKRVSLAPRDDAGNAVVVFDVPTAAEMAACGLDAEGSRQILSAPWWEEMAADIVETPEMCDPSDPEEQVLMYARDVVDEYIRKRAKL